MVEGEIRRGTPPFDGHLLIKKGNNLIIYREGELITGKHSFKFKDTPFNDARANLLLLRLNHNKHPAQIIYNHLKEIGKIELLSHSIFDKLKGKNHGKK